MPSHVRLKDIAKALNVSVTTVSMALNDHPKISAARRAEIRELADKLGYEKNPLLTALASYRSKEGPVRYLENIAWVVLASGLSDPILQYESPWPHLDALTRYAATLGYRLETVFAGRTVQSHRAAMRVLRTRGIRGIILDPKDMDLSEVALEWENLAVVALSNSIINRPLVTVATDHFASMHKLVHEVRRRGYQRPGLAFTAVKGTPAALLWVGGYEAACTLHKQTQHVPPLVFSDVPFSAALLEQWLNDHRPDVIIGPQGAWMIEWFERFGQKVPDTLGYCSLDLQPDKTPHISGVVAPRYQVRSVAIDLLAGMLRSNAVGVPAHPYELGLRARWHEGTTLRPVLATG